jgi:hypothetical protein
MNILRTIKATTISVVALGLIGGVSIENASGYDYQYGKKKRKFTIAGVAVTGPNDLCGEPKWILPALFPPNLHFTLSASFNSDPDATDAIELSPENCSDNLILATHTNITLNTIGGGIPDADYRIKNIPLHQVPIRATLDGTRVMLPSESESNGTPFPVTRSLPNDPITFGQWRKGSGVLKVTCRENGTAKYTARFRNLIPNGVYTMVATWALTDPQTGNPTFAPLPFGGIPNEVVANGKGYAGMERELAACPMDVAADGSELMFVDLGFHADASTYGVFPQTPLERERFVMPDGQAFESFIPPGIVTMPHIGFPIRVTER